jgi:hypothetical protein
MKRTDDLWSIRWAAELVSAVHILKLASAATSGVKMNFCRECGSRHVLRLTRCHFGKTTLMAPKKRAYSRQTFKCSTIFASTCPWEPRWKNVVKTSYIFFKETFYGILWKIVFMVPIFECKKFVFILYFMPPNFVLYSMFSIWMGIKNLNGFGS